LKPALKIGKNMLSVDMTPCPEEDEAIILANAKLVINWAWALE